MNKCEHKKAELWEAKCSDTWDRRVYVWKCLSCGRTTNSWYALKHARMELDKYRYQMDDPTWQGKLRLVRRVDSIKVLSRERLKEWTEKGLETICPFCRSQNTDSIDTVYSDNMFCKDMKCCECGGVYCLEYKCHAVGYRKIDEEGNESDVWYPYDFKKDEVNKW